MRDIAEGFRVGDRLIPWGTTREQALRMLGVRRKAPSHYDITLPCRWAYGLPALSVRLSGPGADRPVTGAAYDIAHIGGLRPVDWVEAVESLLDSPGKVGRHELPGSSRPEDCVVLTSDWSLGDVGVGMSIFAAPRRTARGGSAGMLWLSWREEVAARPYLAEWTARCERLAEVAATLTDIQVFALAWPASPVYGSDSGSETHAKRSTRFLKLCLNAPELLATPPQIARRLSPSQFAVWTSGSEDLWAASTRWETRAAPSGTPVTVDWIELLPAKGAGFSALEIGRWRVTSRQGSRDIARAAGRLGAFPGVEIERHEGYDC